MADISEKPRARRTFLVAAWSAMALALLGLLGAFIRSLFPSPASQKPRKLRLQRALDYPENRVDTRHKDAHKLFVLRDGNHIAALSAQCTHLGCILYWYRGERMFRCPCHGSRFDMQGRNTGGPAPRPMERYAVNIDDKGRLVVDLSQKFRNEKEEWDLPEARAVL
jgi:cytochrome b6-f complex iron-sulfur subunit